MIRGELEGMGEIVPKETFEDTLVQGLTSNYHQVKFAIYRDHPSYSLDETQATMPNLYVDETVPQEQLSRPDCGPWQWLIVT